MASLLVAFVESQNNASVFDRNNVMVTTNATTMMSKSDTKVQAKILRERERERERERVLKVSTSNAHALFI